MIILVEVAVAFSGTAKGFSKPPEGDLTAARTPRPAKALSAAISRPAAAATFDAADFFLASVSAAFAKISFFHNVARFDFI